MKRPTITLFLGVAVALSGCAPARVHAPVPALYVPQSGQATSTTVEPEVVSPHQILVDPRPEATEAVHIPPPTSTAPVPAETADTPVASAVVKYLVPFVSQAPFAVWDAFHQETCEEASMIMAVAFFKQKPLDAHLMEQELIDLVAWEEQHGYGIDVSASQVVEILSTYFEQSARVLSEVSAATIIKELQRGNLIIVPAAGRRLGNPYYTPPGPLYHMLVITGYDNNTHEFITNDPGTRRGQSYRYDYLTLLAAVADWDASQISGGMDQLVVNKKRRVLVIVEKSAN